MNTVSEQIDYLMRLYSERHRGTPRKVILNVEDYTTLAQEMRVDLLYEDIEYYGDLIVEVDENLDDDESPKLTR